MRNKITKMAATTTDEKLLLKLLAYSNKNHAPSTLISFILLRIRDVKKGLDNHPAID